MTLEFQTGTAPINKNADINLRAILAANRSYFDHGTDSSNNPRGVLLTDVVIWKATLEVTNVPSNAWISGDVPPRYRLGTYRLFYRGAVVESGFLTQLKVDLASFAYAFDAPYQAPTYALGNFPKVPYSEGFGEIMSAVRLSADRLVINLIDSSVSANLVLHTYKRPAAWAYFF